MKDILFKSVSVIGTGCLALIFIYCATKVIAWAIFMSREQWRNTHHEENGHVPK